MTNSQIEVYIQLYKLSMSVSKQSFYVMDFSIVAMSIFCQSIVCRTTPPNVHFQFLELG